ncbi:hypothetical protein KDD93_05625 [Campylobacter sp. faydin G-24]|uniref:Periplasmic protein n=1 Tax=Campylobacter anatolicus TaxID=2829105 RepID=A0ABS5HIF5_9BACT|nr:hypothetical protein [Campylobacter anatolicus]MBR8464051.1 hypothetical protein [Campylobacter anatolicus]
MRKFIFLCIICNQIFAINASEIVADFSAGEYKKVCSNAVESYFKKSDDEEIMSLYGMACLKLHEINRLAAPMFKLVRNKQSRENAAYFADILLKKKLLYHAVIDDVDISYIRLPRSDYILSFIFDKFVKKEYINDSGTYIFKEANSDTHYELSVKDGEIKRLVLRIFKDEEIKTEIEYW